MQVTVDSLAPSLEGLRLGTVVRYSEGGPVRFVDVLLPWALFDADVREMVLTAFNKIQARERDLGEEGPTLLELL